jgi:hypothetical protein
MEIKINGVSIEKPLPIRFQEEVDKLNELVSSKSREVRRSKPFKSLTKFMAMVVPLGFTSVAHAQTLSDNPLENVAQGKGIITQLAEKAFPNPADYVRGQFGFGTGVDRKDTVIWHLNEWFEKTLLNTQDFFGNHEIIQLFHTIWTICMSFVGIIIAKKGFDMVKARVLGSSTIGASELIIRLLASVVMTFLSLDIMHLGIQGSNLVIKTLFSALESHLIPYEVLQDTGGINLVMWFIGFSFMFVVISLQYWVRQMTIVMLGVLTPVATLSWVVDGGAMLGTLIREFITLITTPLIHGVILGLNSIFIRELIPHVANPWLQAIDIIMIGFASMFLMIVSPSFLKKFISGTANPLKTVAGLSRGVLGNTAKLIKIVKG